MPPPSPIRRHAPSPVAENEPALPSAPPRTPAEPGADTWVKTPFGQPYRDAVEPYAAALRPPKPRPGQTADLGQLTTPHGMRKVVASAEGRIGIGKVPADATEEVAAIVAWALTASPQHFSAVRQPTQALAIARRLSTLHQELREGVGSQHVALLQARAAALRLLLDLAVRARELNAPRAHNEISRLLAARLDAEPAAELRDFGNASIARALEQGPLPALEKRATVLFPKSPPYEAWKKDGKLRIHFLIDDKGTSRSRAIGHLEEMGFMGQALADGTIRFTRAARGKGLPIELDLAPVSQDRPDIFGQMGEARVDVIVYSGHAGYGQNVRDALARGVRSSGEGKLVLLYQCSGVRNTADVKDAFPFAQFSSTTETTSDDYDEPMFEELIAGFERTATWEDIRIRVNARLRDVDASRDLSEHYFYPSSLAATEGDIDRDKDGVADVDDRTFNVSLPSQVQVSADGVEGAAPTLRIEHLQAGDLVRATGDLALVFRNTHLLAPEEEVLTAWSARAVVAEGFFAPSPGERAAFRFTWDAAGRRLGVRLSTHYSHAQAGLLGAMLVAEAGLFLSDQAGLESDARTQLVLSMLERHRHQTMARRPWAAGSNDAFVFWRYGIPTSFTRLLEASGNPDDFGLTDARKVGDWARSQGFTARAARAITSPIAKVDELAAKDPERLRVALGLTGTLQRGTAQFWGNADAYRYYWQHDGRLDLLEVNPDTGGTFIVRQHSLAGETVFALAVEQACDTEFGPDTAQEVRAYFRAARARGLSLDAALAETQLESLIRSGYFMDDLPVAAEVLELENVVRVLEHAMERGGEQREAHTRQRSVRAAIADYRSVGGSHVDRWIHTATRLAQRLPTSARERPVYERRALALTLLGDVPDGDHRKAALATLIRQKLALSASKGS